MSNDMQLSVTMTDSLRSVDPEEWRQLEDGRDLYLSYPWLAAIEEGSSSRRYLLLRDKDDRLVGALPIYVSDEAPGGSYEPGTLFLHRLGIAVPEGGAVLVGSRAGYSNQPLLDKRLTPTQRERAVCKLVEVAADFAEEQDRIPVMLYVVDEGVQNLVGASTSPALLIDAQAVMYVVARTQEEHLRMLSSHKRRNIRHELKAFEEAGYEIVVSRLSECYRIVGPLLANLQAKHGNEMSADRATKSFQEKIPYLDDISTILLCRLGNHVVGFAHLIEWGDTLYLRSCGFDYERIRKAGEYGMLCYHMPLRLACNRGLRRLHFGISSLEAKLLRGCRLEPLWSVLVGKRWATAIDHTKATAWNGAARTQIAALLKQFAPRQVEAWLAGDAQSGFGQIGALMGGRAAVENLRGGGMGIL